MLAVLLLEVPRSRGSHEIVPSEPPIQARPPRYASLQECKHQQAELLRVLLHGIGCLRRAREIVRYSTEHVYHLPLEVQVHARWSSARFPDERAVFPNGPIYAKRE